MADLKMRARIDYLPDESRTALDPIPWPTGLEPVPLHSDTFGTDGSDGLPSCDVVVVPWTAAEALAVSRVLTPGIDSTSWLKYTHNWDTFAPLISHYAPAWEAKDLGKFWVSTVGDKRVLCLKSDLHMSQDGEKLPVLPWWKQVISDTGASLIITTGTAGGIGAGTKLGDVVVANHTQFNCQRDFKSQPWAHTSFATSIGAFPSPEYLDTAVAKLIPVNAKRLPTEYSDGWPTVGHGDIETTDFFAFDDAEDHYGLRAYNPQAQTVEMGDAVLGLAISQLANPPKWLAIRNASDPQIPQGTSIEAEDQVAGQIYTDNGFQTTVCSTIVAWAYLLAS